MIIFHSNRQVVLTTLTLQRAVPDGSLMESYNGFSPAERNRVATMQRKAILAGDFPAPTKCELCLATSGRLNYHNEDYSKPFDVHPICWGLPHRPACPVRQARAVGEAQADRARPARGSGAHDRGVLVGGAHAGAHRHQPEASGRITEPPSSHAPGSVVPDCPHGPTRADPGQPSLSRRAFGLVDHDVITEDLEAPLAGRARHEHDRGGRADRARSGSGTS